MLISHKNLVFKRKSELNTERNERNHENNKYVKLELDPKTLNSSYTRLDTQYVSNSIIEKVNSVFLNSISDDSKPKLHIFS